MAEIISTQIDNLRKKIHRQSESGEKIEEDRLKQKDGELEKSPGMPVAISKHRPPGLHINDEQQQRPSNRRPVDPDAVARIDHLTQYLEQLSHALAENDRENDREIPKLIHACLLVPYTDVTPASLHASIRYTAGFLPLTINACAGKLIFPLTKYLCAASAAACFTVGS